MGAMLLSKKVVCGGASGVQESGRENDNASKATASAAGPVLRADAFSWFAMLGGSLPDAPLVNYGMSS